MADVTFKRNVGFAFAAGRNESQEFGNTFFIRRVFTETFFQHVAEQGPELVVIGGSVGGKVFQHGKNTLCRTVADDAKITGLLKNFTAYVQRKIFGIDHAFNEAQIVRQQLVGVIHNEDTFNVELHAVHIFSVPKVKRSG